MPDETTKVCHYLRPAKSDCTLGLLDSAEPELAALLVPVERQLDGARKRPCRQRSRLSTFKDGLNNVGREKRKTPDTLTMAHSGVMCVIVSRIKVQQLSIRRVGRYQQCHELFVVHNSGRWRIDPHANLMAIAGASKRDAEVNTSRDLLRFDIGPRHQPRNTYRAHNRIIMDGDCEVERLEQIPPASR